MVSSYTYIRGREGGTIAASLSPYLLTYAANRACCSLAILGVTRWNDPASILFFSAGHSRWTSVQATVVSTINTFWVT